VALHRELLRLRREDPVFARQDRKQVEGAALSQQALVLRYFGGGQEGDRLVLLNLGSELKLDPCPEPLLANVPGRKWKLLLASEQVRFGGQGAPPLPEEGRMRVPDRWHSCSRARETTP
jgi:maltooligosyltrehalose trehalohydrolase